MSTAAVPSTKKPLRRSMTWFVLQLIVTLVLAMLTWLLSEMVHLDTVHHYVPLRNWVALVTLVSLGLTLGALRGHHSKP